MCARTRLFQHLLRYVRRTATLIPALSSGHHQGQIFFTRSERTIAPIATPLIRHFLTESLPTAHYVPTQPVQPLLQSLYLRRCRTSRTLTFTSSRIRPNSNHGETGCSNWDTREVAAESSCGRLI